MLRWILGYMYPFRSWFSTGMLGWGFLVCPAVFHSYAISSAPDSCPKIFHFSLNLYSCFAPNTNWILGLSFEIPGVECILYNWTIFYSCVPLYFVPRGGCLPLSTIIYGLTVSWTFQPFSSTAPGPVEPGPVIDVSTLHSLLSHFCSKLQNLSLEGLRL